MKRERLASRGEGHEESISAASEIASERRQAVRGCPTHGGRQSVCPCKNGGDENTAFEGEYLIREKGTWDLKKRGPDKPGNRRNDGLKRMLNSSRRSKDNNSCHQSEKKKVFYDSRNAGLGGEGPAFQLPCLRKQEVL